MDPAYKSMTRFLVELGTDEIPHSGERFLAHLVGVHRDLERWGCDEAVCRAGMFHSIYGTQSFQKFTLPLDRRSDVRALIGDRAERLAYLNSAMDRPTFDRAVAQDAPPYQFLDRMTGERLELSPAEFDDLCRVHLCDWLEQVPRSKEWDYRRQSYQRMAARLGGVAQEAYDRTYLLEHAAS